MKCIKFFAFLLAASLFIVHHEIANLLIRDEKKKLRYFLKSISLTSRLGLKILNVEVQAPTEAIGEGRLLISNHLSYLDVLVLFSKYPSLFVTSVEMRDVFFLGRITRLAGCFFVERRKYLRSPSTLSRELEQMRTKLEAGFSVFLFPEGTSSCGETVLPFKNTFFQTSLDLKVAVTPFVIKYDRMDLVPWFGDMTFPDHLLKLCGLKKIKATVQMLPKIEPQVFENRFDMAQFSHQSIKECYEQA